MLNSLPMMLTIMLLNGLLLLVVLSTLLFQRALALLNSLLYLRSTQKMQWLTLQCLDEPSTL